MSTPADWSIVVILRFSRLPESQIPTWRSDILLNPVDAILPCSPIQTSRDPLMPVCPSAIRTGCPPVRGSKIRSLRSRHVVANKDPVGLKVRLWIVSPWPESSMRELSGDARSQSLMVCSPDTVARTWAAVGWKRTWPILRDDASIRRTGSKSSGTHPSVPQPSKRVGSTFQIMALPSSPPEATMVSLWGDQSVSSTGAEWLRAKGSWSGSLWGKPLMPWKGEGKGRMAKAPPPEAFQFTLRYC